MILITCYQIIYGNYIMDPVDQACMAAMIDYWISPNAIKKEFEVSKGKFILYTLIFLYQAIHMDS